MKLLFDDLATHQPLSRVVVLSVDPGLYQLRVELDAGELPVWESAERLFTRRNLTAVREALAGLVIAQLVLRQQSAYDEMVGQPLRQGANTLEIPLTINLYPAP